MADLSDQEQNSSRAVDENGAPTCLNCATKLDGEFCHACGQPASTERYSLKTLFQEIFIQLRKFEAMKSLRTFSALLWRPGGFLSEYLQGKRVDYIGPIRYFFYAFFIEVSLTLFVGQFLPPGPVLEGTQAGWEREIVDLGLTMIWGLLWFVLYRKADLNLVEFMVAAIYFVAQTSMFSALLLIVTFPLTRYFGLSQQLYGELNVLVYFGYSCLFALGVFRERWWVTMLKQFLVIGIFYAGYVLVSSN